MLDYAELISSHLPALRLLTGMGWQYLPPAEVNALRGGRRDAVILEGVLREWLGTHNAIRYQGQRLPFSEANLTEALRRLKHLDPTRGLIPASLEVYELLTLGTSLEQTLNGDRRSFSLHYIDWEQPTNNLYHITDEFSVEMQGSRQTRRPDIILFVNGIPLVVIECKRADLEDPLGQAVSQMIRNQMQGEIPHLFVYSQLLIAAQPQAVRYGTTGTPLDYWAVWKEPAESGSDEALAGIINRTLSEAEKAALYHWRDEASWLQRQLEGEDSHPEGRERLPTAQDHALYALLHPARLLELVYQFIVYDNSVKKIARYQQYFAIKATVARVLALNAQGGRTGGVIWHTTGSGKSLTMVMLAKALALHPHIPNPRVIIVTDRIDLDDQIWRTFTACGKQVVRATSGAHLVELVRSPRVEIITTVIDKFETAAREKAADPSADIFVLVDESHRGQYGINHALMRKVFENACYIGFTGTPLLTAEKTTAARFGGFIHTYSMRQAVEDEAVVRLLYEGRMVDLEVSHSALDEWFERRTRDLNEAQKLDLKRKMSRSEEINRIDRRLRMIAFDLAEHYKKNFRGTGLKAQLATSSKLIALQYLHLLSEDEGIRCAVVISAPDMREGSEDIEGDKLAPVQDFWRRTMAKYGSEEAYNREIMRSFHEPDGLEVLIVVDKLLVGFDEPRNTVLYIDKPLREHGLLQAIARVNRVFPGKDYGIIVDYRGVLGELDEAMQTYSALEGYDAADVDGTVNDVSAVITALPGLHAAVWDVFKTCPNPDDNEAMERFLEPEDIRHAFYEALTDFAQVLKVAFASVTYYDLVSERQTAIYKRDLAKFHNLRAAVRNRYAETIDFRDYESKIRKLMNEHIQANRIVTLVSNLDIFNQEQFAQELARLEGRPAAQGDTIASHARRAISEHNDEDPAFYRKLSQLIDETIQLYKQGRIDEIEYLRRMKETETTLANGISGTTPPRLRQFRDARAYYGVMVDLLDERTPDLDSVAELVISFEQALEALKVRDWVGNRDIENQMKLALDDLLYQANSAQGWNLTSAEQDAVLDGIIEVARRRDSLP
ncbi:MAG: type I restriction endonuclease subunit R [Anaerolineae bacterium]|nr:type I restriction endonuclease subunit R [Anaerolineae bacterium]